MPVRNSTYVRKSSLLSFSALPVALLAFLLCSLAAACSGGDHKAGPQQVPEKPSCIPGVRYDYYRMDFGLDYRDQGTLSFRATCDELDGTMTLAKGNEFVSGSVPYAGKGTLYRFAESGDTLYTIKFAGAPIPDGKCADKDISLSMSLSAKKGSSYLVGGLTSYCGKDVFYGRPARVMRMSGTLEQSDQQRKLRRGD